MVLHGASSAKQDTLAELRCVDWASVETRPGNIRRARAERMCAANGCVLLGDPQNDGFLFPVWCAFKRNTKGLAAKKTNLHVLHQAKRRRSPAFGLTCPLSSASCPAEHWLKTSFVWLAQKTRKHKRQSRGNWLGPLFSVYFSRVCHTPVLGWLGKPDVPRGQEVAASF